MRKYKHYFHYRQIKSQLFFYFVFYFYYMTEKQRVEKVIDWLIYMGYGRSEKEIAEKIGYTKASFSQIKNGRIPLSRKFAERLSAIDENVNKVWILTGEGVMLKRSYPEGSIPATAADGGVRYGKGQMKESSLAGTGLVGEIEMLTLLEILKEKDRQIEVLQTQVSDLISLLKS